MFFEFLWSWTSAFIDFSSTIRADTIPFEIFCKLLGSLGGTIGLGECQVSLRWLLKSETHRTMRFNPSRYSNFHVEMSRSTWIFISNEIIIIEIIIKFLNGRQNNAMKLLLMKNTIIMYISNFFIFIRICSILFVQAKKKSDSSWAFLEAIRAGSAFLAWQCYGFKNIAVIMKLSFNDYIPISKMGTSWI